MLKIINILEFIFTSVLQVDKYYLYHPQCRVQIKSESRMKMTAQEAEKWIEKLRKKLIGILFYTLKIAFVE